MKSAIFKSFILSVLIVAQVHFAYSQTASILPNAKTTFVDANGKPLTSGTVDFYIPGGTTRKTTWKDAAETIPNTNPVTLDAAGRALILGSGDYRQVVKDRNGNVIWDQVTSSTGTSSGGGTTSTGDGDLVGTIKPWAGITAPSQYAFAYGQELSRTTFASLYTAIVSTQGVFCNSGSPVLNGLSDTNSFWIGMTLEVSCLGAGNSTIISKTASTVTMASNANVTSNTTASFFPWGRGNGTTTFNVPDLRGVVLAGNNIMGGVSSSLLTTTYFGTTDPNSAGALGGNQNRTVLLSNLPPYTPSGAIANGTISFLNTQVTSTATGANLGMTTGPSTANANMTGVLGPSQGASIFTGTAAGNGGVAATVAVSAAGGGYTNGAQPASMLGGTCSTQPTVTVTVVGNAFSSVVVLNPGVCSVIPSNPVFTSLGGAGSINVTWTAAPLATVQPTRTVNYIIKTTPDTNSATASGVTSLGLMTGDITCSTFTLCTGNNISVTGAPTGGLTGNLQIANFNSGTSAGATTFWNGAGTWNTAVTSLTPGNGLTSTLTATAPGSAVTTTGTISAAQPVNAQTGTTYAILDTDRAKLITATNAAAQAYSIAQAGTASAFQAGWFTFIENNSTNVAGIVTITPATSQICAQGTCAATYKIQPGQFARITSDGTNYQVSDNPTTAQLPGTTTNDAANAGNVGEYLENSILLASAAALVTGTPKTIATITLAPGDWDVDCVVNFNPSGAPSITALFASISLVTNTLDLTVGRFTGGPMAAVLPASTNFGQAVPPLRFSVSSNTSVFMVAQSTFTNSLAGYGILRARRVR